MVLIFMLQYLVGDMNFAFEIFLKSCLCRSKNDRLKTALFCRYQRGKIAPMTLDSVLKLTDK